MAKKSKATRQYNKQLQRQQKILKKAQQKRIKLDLTPSKQPQQKPTKKDVVRLRKQNIQYDKQVKSKTNNKQDFKLTNKQLQKAVQSRKLQQFKPAKIKPPKISKPKATKEIEKVEQKIKPKVEQEVEPEPESYRPEQPTQPHPPVVNESDSFYSDTIIKLYRENLKYYPQHAEPLLNNWLDSLIAKYGVDDVATMIQQASSNGVILTYEIAYDTYKMHAYIAEMLNYLPEMTLEWASDVLDAFDEWADIL